MTAERGRQLQFRPAPFLEHAIDQQVLPMVSGIPFVAREPEHAGYVDWAIIIDLDVRAMAAGVAGEGLPRHVPVKADRDGFVLRQINDRRDGFATRIERELHHRLLTVVGNDQTPAECGDPADQRILARQKAIDLTKGALDDGQVRMADRDGEFVTGLVVNAG